MKKNNTRTGAVIADNADIKRLHSNIYDREALADFIIDEQRLWRAQKHFDRLTTAEGMRTKTAFRLMLATYAEI